MQIDIITIYKLDIKACGPWGIPTQECAYVHGGPINVGGRGAGAKSFFSLQIFCPEKYALGHWGGGGGSRWVGKRYSHVFGTICLGGNHDGGKKTNKTVRHSRWEMPKYKIYFQL